MSFRGFLVLVAGLVPAYLVLAAVLPPADDELYYWCWSERLQLSYYDHPPMTAYLIRAATSVFGDTLLAVRLPAVLSTLTVLVVVGYLTRPRTLLPLVVWTPLFTFGAVLVTPDTPLLMFWALYLVWLVKVQERVNRPHPPAPSPIRRGGKEKTETPPPNPLPRGGRGDRTSELVLSVSPSPCGGGGRGVGSALLWPLGGLILGCGILGKYTTGLAVMAGFLSFALAGNWRRWAVGYAVHLGVAFLVTLPILVHNVRYDFVPLQYQWRHSMSSPRPGVVPFLEFVGVQLLLFGAVPFVMLGWAARRWRVLAADPRLRVCLCLFAFPFAFFLFKATRGPLEGNWALACYIAVWPLAARWYEGVRHSTLARRLTALAFAPPAAAVVLLAVHLVWPIPILSPGADRITRQAGKVELTRDLAATLREVGPGEPVYVPSYQWTAMLRFHGVDARQVAGMTRPSHFTQYPETPAGRDRALVFGEGFLPPEYAAGFGPPRILGKFPLVVRGQEVGVYWLIEYSRSDGAADTVPAPARLDRPAPPPAP
ncbi:MAG: glycosyltransferase family 39 protein [Gemmataceae bacterium]|nr:glycosyltransferase family 39 protein [Gemmataceae bacterium]